jgi:threonylcarbamoyladenosine tRNA methylthiotransferase MtaB
MPSYYTHSFGCRANQADGAAIEKDLSAHGFTSSKDYSAAEVVILNSCTVTAAADADLRQSVQRIHRENPGARIVITGCYAQRRPEELAALPGVEWVVGNSHKSEIGALVERKHSSDLEERSASSAEFVPVSRLTRLDYPDDDSGLLGSIGTARILISDVRAQRRFAAAPFFGGTVEDRTRPNLKIQDGCNSQCSFCVIPSVRGLSRSLAPAEVIGQVRSLTVAGYREVVISGVNLGQYGGDLSPRLSFTQLLHRLLNETPVDKLRLSSVEPMDYTDSLLDLMESTARIARHVHAPLQSGSDRILRLMHRKYTAAKYRERILAAYARFPNAAFGADVIAGFPSESERDFEQTCSLIDSLPMTYLHVFPYSRRPGTAADQMPQQVSPPVIRERARCLRELSARKNKQFQERQVGIVLSAIILDDPSMNVASAISDNYLAISINSAQNNLAPNTLIQARILSTTEHGLLGMLV